MKKLYLLVEHGNSTTVSSIAEQWGAIRLTIIKIVSSWGTKLQVSFRITRKPHEVNRKRKQM